MGLIPAAIALIANLRSHCSSLFIVLEKGNEYFPAHTEKVDFIACWLPDSPGPCPKAIDSPFSGIPLFCWLQP